MREFPRKESCLLETLFEKTMQPTRIVNRTDKPTTNRASSTLVEHQLESIEKVWLIA